jgi:hypothetical protein
LDRHGRRCHGQHVRVVDTPRPRCGVGVMAGARTKYTPERVDAIVGGMLLGMTRTAAAWAAGITHPTLAAWAKRYPDFEMKLNEAEAQCIRGRLENIRRVADKGNPNTWQADAWLLERLHPETYGQRAKIDVSLDLKAWAQQLADQFGLPVETVLADANALAGGNLMSDGTKQ